MGLLSWILRPADDPRAFGARRSPRWPAVRDAHLAVHPTCVACGTREQLTVHHVQPFHLFPQLELDLDNLLTLCESPTHNCHLWFGHLLNWSSWNVDVETDARIWLRKIVNRPRAA